MEPQNPTPQQQSNQNPVTVPPQPSVIQPQQPTEPSSQIASGPIVSPTQPTLTPIPTPGGMVSGNGGAFVGSSSSLPAGGGEKSFLLTFLLAFFLGGLGADRYYLGKVGTGLLKMFTLGGFLVWATVDLIILLAGKTKDKQGNSLSGYEQNRKIAFIIFTVFTLINILAGAFAIYTITQATKEVVKTVSETVKDASEECSNGQCAADPAPTAFKEVVTSEGVEVNILSAQIDPKTSGDPADADKQYVAIRFSIVNQQASSIPMPGMFYYKTADGKLFNDASTISGGSTDSAKNVQLVDDLATQNLAGTTSIDAGTVYADQYLIFHVPKGELGQLVWFKVPLDTNSTKLAIFDLK